MKWLTFAGILLYLTRHSEAGALKCTSESQDPSCASEKRDILPVQSIVRREQDTAPTETECLAGSEWESNCHKCRCTESGIAVCLKDDSCDLQVYDEPIRCKPYSTFQRDCNVCTCLETGLGLCTLRSCVPLVRRKRHSMQCQPGSTWKNSCNDCECHSTGVATCTRMECSGDSSDDNKVCSPGTEWTDDCNTCHCTSQGAPKCTELKCSTRQKRHSMQCKPGSTWKNSCNECQCHSTGVATCTRMGCLDDSSEDLFNWESNKVCSPGTEWTDDCNTCRCTSKGAPKCTELKCSTRQKRHSMQCKPGSTWKNSCNDCQCLSNGVATCTRVECSGDSSDSEREKRDTSKTNSTLIRRTRAGQEPPKACQPGQEFRMDCNKCLCNDEGQDFSCTRIDCASLNNNGGGGAENLRTKREISDQVKTEQCEPGSLFNRECNYCRCTKDGMHATCTMKPCKKETVKETEPVQSFRCTPGEQFKKDCKDCTCSADGKTIYCTLRLCDEVLTDV